MLTVDQAFEAGQHAEDVIRETDGDIDQLDEASDVRAAYKNCPEHFTEPQMELAQRLILRVFERAIGRA